VSTIREQNHPKARLLRIKNNRRGLRSRTMILNALDEGAADTKTTASKTSLQYRNVLYHLKLLEAERAVTRRDGKPYLWSITGLGQKSLTNSYHEEALKNQ